MNTLFGVAYFLVGIDEIHGAKAPTAPARFMNAFFFSAQTLSMVGYGT